MQNSNQNSENESLPFACNESKRKTMFKFRDDEEDERKTMRYSDSALTGKKTKSFLWEIEIFNRVWKQCMCKSGRRKVAYI